MARLRPPDWDPDRVAEALGIEVTYWSMAEMGPVLGVLQYDRDGNAYIALREDLADGGTRVEKLRRCVLAHEIAHACVAGLFLAPCMYRPSFDYRVLHRKSEESATRWAMDHLAPLELLKQYRAQTPGNVLGEEQVPELSDFLMVDERWLLDQLGRMQVLEQKDGRKWGMPGANFGTERPVEL